MSEQTTAEKLAAVRCDAAPYGWQPTTRDGSVIESFDVVNQFWFVVGLRGSGGGGRRPYVVRQASGSRVNIGEPTYGSDDLDLVPLPAPTTCDPTPPPTSAFPADLPGWFFRSSRLCLVSVRCTAARDGDFIMLESHEWIRVSDLRTWQRSSSLEGPWEDYVGGEWKVVASG